MLAIISDTHDNYANLEKFFKYAKDNKISEVICLGDVANDETIEKIAGLNIPIHLVKGNMDYFDEDLLKNFSNIKYYGLFGKIKIAGKKIVFTHKPEDLNALLRPSNGGFRYDDATASESPAGDSDGAVSNYDYAFYGHTHQPWQEKRGQTIFLNPGTVAGTFSKATFAVWDEKNDKFKLVLIDEL